MRGWNDSESRHTLRLFRRGTTPAYTRLSPQDTSFLAFEKPGIHMHVGAAAIFDATSFRASSGAVDVDKFRRYITSRFPMLPRCRQRLAYVPVTRQPIWIDDPDFKIENHIKEVTLPAPGDDAALKQLAGEIFSRPLDRSRSLWEMWVVQGHEHLDRFAIISKAHHGMIDGIAGMDFIGALLTPEAVAETPATPAFVPRPAPARARLLWDEALRYASTPYRLAKGIVGLATDGDARREFGSRSLALVRFFVRGIRGTSNSPLSVTPTTARSFDWFVRDRTEERSLRARIGGTRDDVTLATSAGAVRDFLMRNGTRLRGLRLRAMAPINLRTNSERGTLGNHVSMLIVDLPVTEADPRRRFERIISTTARLKQHKHDLGVDILAQIDRWLPAALAQRTSMWLATRVRAYNIVVTNIPGPPIPLYALESKLIDLYPLAPVFGGQYINVAALTYCGKLYWGVHYAGPDPDELPRFTHGLEVAFDELVAAAAAAPPRLRVVDPAPALDTGEDERKRAAAAIS